MEDHLRCVALAFKECQLPIEKVGVCFRGTDGQFHRCMVCEVGVVGEGWWGLAGG